MAEVALEVEGLDEFRRGLKHAADPKAAKKEFGSAQRDIAKEVGVLAKAMARSAGGEKAHFAAKINYSSTKDGAAIGVRPPGAAAFWGAKKRTGWYAKGRYSQSTGRQHPAWVDQNWTPGVAGQGPQPHNDAIAAQLPHIEQQYLDAIERVSRSAFPE
jgi:hypothetical protein